MTSVEHSNWYDANQRYLSAALAVVRSALERYIARRQGKPEEQGEDAQKAFQEAAADMSSPATLETLCRLFGLSSFERDILLLCAGMELDSAFAACCADAQGDPRRVYPTFSLALAALPEPHWSALNPSGQLRHWRLIEIGEGSAITLSLLRIDERILHNLTAVQHLDERLVGMVEPLQVSVDPVPSHRALAERIVAIWSQAEGRLPVIQLCGGEYAGKQSIVAAACANMGLGMSLMSAHVLPISPSELEAMMRLWNREAILNPSVLMLDCHDADMADATRENVIERVITGIRGPLVVASFQRRRSHGYSMITIDVGKPTAGEQRAIWRSALGEVGIALDGDVATLVSQFNLSAPVIYSISSQVLGENGGPGNSEEMSADRLREMLWNACRARVRPRLDDLAQRIDPAANWNDLVLPETQRRILEEIAVHVRNRMKVYETWGFAAKSHRGLGISALFAGASGTGKTMASEALANELKLDLYRIDLSAVVSKYIGETEKNLRRVFDAAEEGGAILLFDEADALFGKRSEVKDSHDRYANIEISYLLQRMEAYRGLAILTTNMKSALDKAFLRRIRFIVRFPFPDAGQRMEIWRRIFPDETPTDGLDYEKLARLNVTGGNISNMAMNAAFLAAEAGEPVRMKHLVRAAQTEYAKLEKPLTEAEIRGWC